VLVVIVVLLIVLSAVARGCAGGGDASNKETSTDSGTKEEEKKESGKKKGNKKEKEQVAAVAVGQPVTAGDIEWIVTNAGQTNQLSQESFGQFGDTKQGNFIVVDVRFTNNGGSGSITVG
jgi:hypothetical protein